MISGVIISFIICLIIFYLIKNKLKFNNQIYYDASLFTKLNILKQNFKIIQNECLYVYNNYQITDKIKRNTYEEWNGNLDRIYEFIKNNNNEYWLSTSTDKWFNYALMINNTTLPGITKMVCPHTTKILESIGGINVAGFALANKDCIIEPHTDATGPSYGTLAYHLCLIGESTLIVNGESVIQSPGKVIIFNPEHTHSLYNHTNKDRIILYIDFKIN